jgi:3-deoxy-manno-octulosonate cytidylyltransferase (CMP-KDO synthetase)
VAEVAAREEYRRFDIIINVQGDEPFLPIEAVLGALGRVSGGDEIGTAAAPLLAEHAADPDRVKVVTDLRGRALYFSRAVIPHCRESEDDLRGLYWQHLGVYAYSRSQARVQVLDRQFAGRARRPDDGQEISLGLRRHRR